MNPFDELLLVREEGRDLLDRLTLLTKKGRLSWECVRYAPMDILATEPEDGGEIVYLAHSMDAVAAHADLRYEIQLSECLSLTGIGAISLILAVRKKAVDAFYDNFADKSNIQFADALMAQLAGSDAINTAFDSWPFPASTEWKKISTNPIARLGRKLFAEQRTLDFHMAVCHPVTLKKLLFEIT